MADEMPRTCEGTLDIGAQARRWSVTTTAWQDALHAVRGVIEIAQAVADRKRLEHDALLHAGRLGAMATEIVVAEDLGARFGVEIEWCDENCPAVQDEVVRMLLFRAVRELLINTATRAGVRTTTVRLGRSADRELVTVEDRGCGFDAEDCEAHGCGLFGIREQKAQRRWHYANRLEAWRGHLGGAQRGSREQRPGAGYGARRALIGASVDPCPACASLACGARGKSGSRRPAWA